jgi:hypothetical protein
VTDILPQLVVNMKRDDPRMGIAQIVCKITGPDKDKIDAAAAALGLSQGKYVRILLVSASEYVMEQLDLEFAPSNQFVDLTKGERLPESEDEIAPEPSVEQNEGNPD